MNFGTSTPVEVAVTGPDFAASRTFAAKVRDELARIPALRDLQYGQALDYPAIQVDVNRQMAGQLGRHRRSGRPLVCRGDLVQPVRRAELLGRPAHGHRVPGAGPGPAAASMTTLDDLRVVPVSGDRGSHAPARRRRDRSTTPRSSANTIASTGSGW